MPEAGLRAGEDSNSSPTAIVRIGRRVVIAQDCLTTMYYYCWHYRNCLRASLLSITRRVIDIGANRINISEHVRIIILLRLVGDPASGRAFGFGF